MLSERVWSAEKKMNVDHEVELLKQEIKRLGKQNASGQYTVHAAARSICDLSSSSSSLPSPPGDFWRAGPRRSLLKHFRGDCRHAPCCQEARRRLICRRGAVARSAQQCCHHPPRATFLSALYIHDTTRSLTHTHTCVRTLDIICQHHRGSQPPPGPGRRA